MHQCPSCGGFSQLDSCNMEDSENSISQDSDEVAAEAAERNRSVGIERSSSNNGNSDEDCAKTQTPGIFLKKAINTEHITPSSYSKTLGDEDSVEVGKSRATPNADLENSEHNAQKVLDDMPQRKNNDLMVKKGVSTTWADLLRQNRDPTMCLKLEEIHTDDDIVDYDDDDAEDLDEAWGFCLLGFFSGSFPGKKTLHDLCNSWKVEYLYNFHNSGWIIFKFPTNEDRLQVLNGGPYSRAGRQLHLKPIPKFFSFDPKEMTVVPVWVKIHDWPLDLWHKKALSKFASKLGSPDCTDALTCLKKSVSYARVLVHIDATKELKKEITIRLPSRETRTIKVEYEHAPKYCSNCNTLTHNTQECYFLKKADRNQVNTQQTEEAPKPDPKNQKKYVPMGKHTYLEDNNEEENLNQIAEAFNGRIDVISTHEDLPPGKQTSSGKSNESGQPSLEKSKETDNATLKEATQDVIPRNKTSSKKGENHSGAVLGVEASSSGNTTTDGKNGNSNHKSEEGTQTQNILTPRPESSEDGCTLTDMFQKVVNRKRLQSARRLKTPQLKNRYIGPTKIGSTKTGRTDASKANHLPTHQ